MNVIFTENEPMGVLSQDEIDALLAGNDWNVRKTFKNADEFSAFLTERRQQEELYGNYPHSPFKEITMCRFFETKNNENILADIAQRNKEQNMGNFQIPNTNIKLINFSICPKCARVFSFKELIEYYVNPNYDSTFKDRANQYREDTRVFCNECKTYFLPSRYYRWNAKK